MTASPVVALNHAVAVGMADGPQAGLALLDDLEGLEGYHLFHAANGELLAEAGNVRSAVAALSRALPLTANEVERAHLRQRILQLGGDPQPSA